MIDEEKVKLPSYSGVWMPWNRRICVSFNFC